MQKVAFDPVIARPARPEPTRAPARDGSGAFDAMLETHPETPRPSRTERPDRNERPEKTASDRGETRSEKARDPATTASDAPPVSKKSADTPITRQAKDGQSSDENAPDMSADAAMTDESAAPAAPAAATPAPELAAVIDAALAGAKPEAAVEGTVETKDGKATTESETTGSDDDASTVLTGDAKPADVPSPIAVAVAAPAPVVSAPGAVLESGDEIELTAAPAAAQPPVTVPAEPADEAPAPAAAPVPAAAAQAPAAPPQADPAGETPAPVLAAVPAAAEADAAVPTPVPPADAAPVAPEDKAPAKPAAAPKVEQAPVRDAAPTTAVTAEAATDETVAVASPAPKGDETTETKSAERKSEAPKDEPEHRVTGRQTTATDTHMPQAPTPVAAENTAGPQAKPRQPHTQTGELATARAAASEARSENAVPSALAAPAAGPAAPAPMMPFGLALSSSLAAPAQWQPVALRADASTDKAVPVAGLAVEIVSRAQEGSKRFDIRLDPPELGRIDVRLDVDSGGKVTSRLVVERAETLDLLRRDAPQLERALQHAGLNTEGGLQFSLRDQGFAQREQLPREGANVSHLIVPEDEAAAGEAARRGYGRLIGLGGGLDIRV